MVDTTVMRHSAVGDQWIYDACQMNPVQRVFNDKGEWTGNILTGPVRLAFTDNLLEAGPAMKNDPKSRIIHGVTVLFTPWTNLQLFFEEFNRIAQKDFADHYDAPSQQFYGLDNPFQEQQNKLKYDGYTPGLKCMNVTSNYKPPVVDTRNLPITDPKKVYPGVWAIVAVNAYPSGKNTPKKGPRFGLQSVMLIGDDTPLGGGKAADPKQQFAKVQVKPPVAVPGAAFGQPAPAVPGVPPATAAFQGGYGTVPATAGGPGYLPPAAPPASPPADDWMAGLT